MLVHFTCYTCGRKWKVPLPRVVKELWKKWGKTPPNKCEAPCAPCSADEAAAFHAKHRLSKKRAVKK